MGILFQGMGGGRRWRSFQTNIIIHNRLKRTCASRLREEDGVVAGNQPIARNVHVVNPMQAMNAVSRDWIVPSDQSTREHWLCFSLINSNLQNSKLFSHSHCLIKYSSSFGKHWSFIILSSKVIMFVHLMIFYCYLRLLNLYLVA